jgi:hypothetical protein
MTNNNYLKTDNFINSVPLFSKSKYPNGAGPNYVMHGFLLQGTVVIFITVSSLSVGDSV